MMFQFHWTDERVAYLREFAATHSASKIAEHLGCTRNAIIGKANRAGISLGKASGVPVTSFAPKAEPLPKPAPVAQAAPAPEPVIEPEPIIEAVAEPVVETPAPPLAPVEALFLPADEAVVWRPARKTLLDLGPFDCRWPIGDPGSDDLVFCGIRRVDHRYCAAHIKLARGVGTKGERRAVSVLRRSAA